MNIKQKILGLPLIYLMVIGIASAAVIGAITYANIISTGTYQPAGAVSRGLLFRMVI